MTDQQGKMASQDYMLLSLLGITSSAPALPFDYLTVRDRLQLPLVSKTVRRHLSDIEYHRCKDGLIYNVPYPGFPGLLESSSDNENIQGLFPHQLASLRLMHRLETRESHYGALRGGLLADAPGLGKTITMLGLIVSTAGQRPQTPKEFWNPVELEEGWQTLTQNAGARYDIMKVLQPFRKSRVVPKDLYRRLEEQVLPPFPINRFPTLLDFERFVRRFLKTVATRTEFELFRQHLVHLKAGLLKSHRIVLMSEAGRRMNWERSLIVTSATLLVVPDALLEHWFQQIHQHINLILFADERESGSSDHAKGSFINNQLGRGVVYIDGVGDIADGTLPLGDVNLNAVSMLQPVDLSKYLMVVTAFSRCEREYQRESLRHTGKRKEIDGHVGKASAAASSQSSSLLLMRWLRIVVDEGHELGAYEGGSDLTRFIHQLAAERRWVLSGTPTTGDEDDTQFSAKALDQLQRLLLFLRHPVYGSMPDLCNAMPRIAYNSNGDQRRDKGTDQKKWAKDLWETEVKYPFLNKQKKGRHELLNVLKNTMVLHRKEDIRLPKPIFRQIEVDVPLPVDVQDNLRKNPKSATVLLSQYLRSDNFQTLVDKAQAEYIINAIESAKQELERRGGPWKAEARAPMRILSEEEMNESSETVIQKDRRPIKAVVYSTSKFNLRDVTEALYSKLSPENIAEAYDEREFNSNGELSRFRHNHRDFRCCPICGHHSDCTGKAFTGQRREKSLQCKNILLEVTSREDPSIRFLIEPERIVCAVPVWHGGNVTELRLNGLTQEEYRSSRKSWRVGDILKVDIRDQDHPLLRKRQSMETWQQYGVTRCIELAQVEDYEGRDWFFGPLPERDRDRVVVEENEYSNMNHMEVTLTKWQPCSRFHDTSRWYSGPTLAQVPVESRQEDAFVLSLDSGLAHGLDLSFVTHIFLLEPLEDAALLEQITSRAHRLGATGPVVVETVNPYYKLNEATVKVFKEFKEDNFVDLSEYKESKGNDVKTGKKVVKSSNLKDSSLTTAVCQHCYRSFDSIALAEKHEETQCPRNPANVDVVDPWHLSSVYREIRPPQPPRLNHSL